MTFIEFESILTRRTGWSVGALLGLLATAGFLQWQARSAPLYAAETTVQFEKTNPADGAAPASAPAEIRTFRQIMVSSRFRSEVAASLTPAERRVVLRPALKHHFRGLPAPTVANALGSIDPEPVGNSAQIRVKVTHEDPEAAALIANRYVEELQTLLSRHPEAIGSLPGQTDAVPFRRLDVAMPNYSAHSPSLGRIRRSLLGLALFAGGLAVAMLSLLTALRNAGEMRSV